MISTHFRDDYAGEFVVLETRWSGGKKQQTREWIDNPIKNHHISGRAACIATDIDYHKFDFTKLQRHRGGLLGSKKLQTYGTGSVTQKMRLDFAVESDPLRLQEILVNNYSQDNIVYTSAKNCIQNPGDFYLIPFNPRLLDLATIVYLAAFDHHKEIFLLGYNRDVEVAKPDWHLQITSVMQAYPATKFWFVGEPTNMYDSWLDCGNAETMPYKTFISYCDI
jgi:hypothetical protein